MISNINLSILISAQEVQFSFAQQTKCAFFMRLIVRKCAKIIYICRIYFDIMTGKICRQFRLLTWNSLFDQLFQRDRVKGVEGENRYFSPLRVSPFKKNKEIWCKTQVIIYTFHTSEVNS